jgi:hypothetical protein
MSSLDGGLENGPAMFEFVAQDVGRPGVLELAPDPQEHRLACRQRVGLSTLQQGDRLVVALRLHDLRVHKPLLQRLLQRLQIRGAGHGRDALAREAPEPLGPDGLPDDEAGRVDPHRIREVHLLHARERGGGRPALHVHLALADAVEPGLDAGGDPLHGDGLDLELLLEAGDDPLAELDGVPGRLPVFLVRERLGVGAVRDGDLLGVADPLQHLVRRLGVRQCWEQRRQEQHPSKHRVDLEME